MSAVQIPVIGIVGGIGSGKSALANALHDHFQCARLDADMAGHRALSRPQVKSALRTEFGDSIFDAQGNIIRSQLAQLVFGDAPAQLAARQKLEKIVHPIIRQDVIDQLEQHQRNRDCELILLDAALLLEAGWSNDCDAVVYVDVPAEIRRKRVADRNWTHGELERREASQLSLEEKQQRSDLIVDNSGDLAEAAAVTADWIRKRFQLSQRHQHWSQTSSSGCHSEY